MSFISSFLLNSSLDDETRPSNAETTTNLSAREEDDEENTMSFVSSFLLNSSLDDETRPSNAETPTNLSAQEEDDEENSFQVGTNSGSASAASSSSFSSSSSGRVLDDMASPLPGYYEDETDGVL